MRRRAALRLLGGAPLAVGLGLSAADVERAHAHAAGALDHAAAGQAYKPRFFNDHEWQTVRMLVDLILPRDERSGSATDAGVPEFMDFLMTDPAEDDRSRESRQTAMRGGLRWMDAECRRRFSKTFLRSSDEERRVLLDAISHGPADDEEDEEDGAAREPRERRGVRLRHGPAFFSSFRDLTASGFWSSKMGVKDLGYMGNVPTLWNGPPAEVLRRLGLDENKRGDA